VHSKTDDKEYILELNDTAIGYRHLPRLGSWSCAVPSLGDSAAETQYVLTSCAARSSLVHEHELEDMGHMRDIGSPDPPLSSRVADVRTIAY
jgi:hypothetical protein